MRLMAGAEPFGFEGVNPETGVLVIHGFTSTPQSVRPWAEHLAKSGWTVLAPRLPGHGTTLADFADSTPEEWVEEAQMSLDGLFEHCSSIFLCGMSMGGAIALDLAARNADRVAGVVCVNPSLYSDDPRARLAPLLGRLPFSVKAIGNDIADPLQRELCYDRVPLKVAAKLFAFQNDVKERLRSVTAPLLLFGSRQDHVVPPGNTSYVEEHVGSTDVQVVWLERSYHVATLDYDAPVIFERSAEFIAKRAAG
ncbi:MAG: alpha/beta hydrolase [Actinomycetota bacterium]